MSSTNRYRLMIGGTLLVLAYVLVAEVADRWTSVLTYYQEVCSHEAMALSPDEIARRKMDLTAKQRFLTANVMKGSAAIEQSQAGVLGLINRCGRESSVKVLSETPSEFHRVGQMEEMGLIMEVQGGYHAIGSFINRLENGPVPTRITKLDVMPIVPASTRLRGTVQGTAVFLSSTVSR